MATARLQLRSKKDATKEVPIYLVIEHQSKELLKYPTGVSVAPKHWNNEKKEVRKVTGISFDDFNQTLNGFLTVVNKAFAKMKAANEPVTSDAIRKVLDVYTKKEVRSDYQHDFLGFIKFEIDKIPSKINMITQREYARQTISKYKCLAKVVSEIIGNRKMDIETVDMNFYYKLVANLQSKKFRPNTIGNKYVGALKTMLNEAKKQGYRVNISYLNSSKEFAMPHEKTLKIYLNEKEIDKIERLDLSKNGRLERVRDVFLIGYYTGQRYSDYTKINKSQFANNTITLMQKKTGKVVEIPLVAKARAIMEKYNWKLPSIADTHFNEYIKEVAEIAEINEKVSHTRSIGNQKETVLKEKWQLVSSHTARRSFATNMYHKNEFQMLHIMEITGHTTVKSFMMYICSTNEDKINIMRSMMEGKKQPVPLAKAV